MSTNEEKGKFKAAFEVIVVKAPEEIRNKWSGKIRWIDASGNAPSIPMFDNRIIEILPIQLKHEYNSLLNTLKARLF